MTERRAGHSKLVAKDRKIVKLDDRLRMARTMVLMAACAYIPTTEPDSYVTQTTYDGFRSLEKAVLEYRAAVKEDERKRHVT